MTSGILNALMQLFAIIAGKSGDVGRNAVSLAIQIQLNAELKEQYLKLYDEFVVKFHGANYSEKRTSLASVRILRICQEINDELEQKDKIMVLLRLLEFVNVYNNSGEQEIEFVKTVAEIFHLENSLYFDLNELVSQSNENQTTRWHGDNKRTIAGSEMDVQFHDLVGVLYFLWLESENFFLVKYLGTESYELNSNPLVSNRIFAFTTGSTIRGPKIHPIFYSDILHNIIIRNNDERVQFEVDSIEYNFPNGNKGLHAISLAEDGGTLVGIMGGSGSGKSTLLNVLNGNLIPSDGVVKLNGVSIYSDKSIVRSSMGYVPQDDILIEELTVFENLYYNTKLLNDTSTDIQLIEKVNATLKSVGLYDCRNLKVGSVLDKSISGGQRKRLNIAFELIREPAVLFLDEPTSGLSSRDSENIIDLLKELTFHGKLIFLVIHQPSSDIFKMLDKLFILDQGGYPIYYGNPLESVLYFKRMTNRINAEQSVCPICGNVNPEQIFNVIESKVVDEFGNHTALRRISPIEWNQFYLSSQIVNKEPKSNQTPEKRGFKPPGFISQWKVFVARDAKSKWMNKQFMLINFLEAPVLALVLSWFLKNTPFNEIGIQEFTFRTNLNFPQYLFIAVVVSLFLGLTVSAEEILKDRKILKRERYLGLSYSGYLLSKVSILFFISLVQSATFVVVGNQVLQVREMFLPFWLVLFSTSCFANILGLIVSSVFNSAKVIYILIPILIIPQLLFSGVIVRFDRLNPKTTFQSKVPLIGEIMVSRWAFEALAVHQFTQNPYETEFFEFDSKLKSLGWRRDYWVKELKARIVEVNNSLKNGKVDSENCKLISHEFERIKQGLTGFEYEVFQPELSIERLSHVLQNWSECAEKLETYFIRNYNLVNQLKEAKISSLTSTVSARDSFLRQKDECYSESLEDMVTDKNDIRRIVNAEGKLIQKNNLIYVLPSSDHFFESHFYSPMKSIGNYWIPTLFANVIVIWVYTFLLSMVLFFDLINKTLQWVKK